jgi:hypothetical protein
MASLRGWLRTSMVVWLSFGLSACSSCTEAPAPAPQRGVVGKLPPLPPTARPPTPTPEPPKCAVILLPSTLDGSAPLAVDFGAEGGCTDGPITFEWDFGDGSPKVTQPSVRHVYQKPGQYTATVTGSDAEGRKDSDSVVITVTP